MLNLYSCFILPAKEEIYHQVYTHWKIPVNRKGAGFFHDAAQEYDESKQNVWLDPSFVVLPVHSCSKGAARLNAG